MRDRELEVATRVPTWLDRVSECSLTVVDAFGSVGREPGVSTWVEQRQRRAFVERCLGSGEQRAQGSLGPRSCPLHAEDDPPGRDACTISDPLDVQRDLPFVTLDAGAEL